MHAEQIMVATLKVHNNYGIKTPYHLLKDI
jgi:hypothetical protein